MIKTRKQKIGILCVIFAVFLGNASVVMGVSDVSEPPPEVVTPTERERNNLQTAISGACEALGEMTGANYVGENTRHATQMTALDQGFINDRNALVAKYNTGSNAFTNSSSEPITNYDDLTYDQRRILRNNTDYQKESSNIRENYRLVRNDANTIHQQNVENLRQQSQNVRDTPIIQRQEKYVEYLESQQRSQEYQRHQNQLQTDYPPGSTSENMREEVNAEQHVLYASNHLEQRRQELLRVQMNQNDITSLNNATNNTQNNNIDQALRDLGVSQENVSAMRSGTNVPLRQIMTSLGLQIESQDNILANLPSGDVTRQLDTIRRRIISATVMQRRAQLCERYQLIGANCTPTNVQNAVNEARNIAEIGVQTVQNTVGEYQTILLNLRNVRLGKEQFDLKSIGTFVSPRLQKETWVKESSTPIGGVWSIINNIIRFLIFTVGLVCVLGIAVGGVMIMISAGNETLLSNGKTTLFHSILGLVIVLLAYVIIAVVQSLVLTLLGGS